MQNRYIMTAFGKDRPGIVADVTQVLYENGCNLEDTTMSMLSEEFTINLLFSANDDNIEATLLERCRNLEQQKNISAFIRPLQERRVTNQGTLPTCTLHIEGMDQAGIVYKISKFLSENQINIESLTTKKSFSPHYGSATYQMEMEVLMPDTVSLDDAEKGLSQIENDLNVDITIS